MTGDGKKFDIKERVLEFVVDVARLADKLPRKYSAQTYAKQLIRASSSIGANLEEADGAVSRKDFLNKLGIARKEANETKYWLQLIDRTGLFMNKANIAELQHLLCESVELKLILSAIIKNTKANS
ncbi:MAG: four helix bundle protein [Candidatus Margulisiibacteriota bacterium]